MSLLLLFSGRKKTLAQKIAALFKNGEQGAWYDPSDFQAGWRRNLFTYTEQFDNAPYWPPYRATVSANITTAPDGSLTADKLIESNISDVHSIQQTVTLTSASYVFSVSAKAAGRQYVSFVLYTSNNNFVYATFDLLNGTVTEQGARGTPTFGSASITASTNGFYQCQLTGTLGKTVMISTSDVSNPVALGGQASVDGRRSYLGDGTSGIYIWGAQLEQGSTATPYQRITDGVQDYLQYQAQPVLYQDAAGTTPVTAVEQPVGLMLDKSRGLTLGNNIVAGFDFTTWTTAGAVSSVTVNSFITTGAGGIIFGSILTVGKTYKIIISGTTTATKVNVRNTTNLTNSASATTRNFNITMNVVWAISPSIYLQNESAGTTTITSFTVQEIFGNHAFQATTTPNDKRPILSARVNLLTKTEQFGDTSVWNRSNSDVSANVTTAPDGTITADLLYPTSTGDNRCIYQVTSIGSIKVKKSIYAKAQNKSILYFSTEGAGTDLTFFDLSSGTIGNVATGVTPAITPKGNGWYECSITYTGTVIFGGVYGVADANGSSSVTANGTDGIYIWGADTRPANIGNNIPAYQRVNTATDYDTAGFPYYLKADGTYTSMSTNSIDFSATDKITTVTGFRNSNNLNYPLIELSATSSTNPGSFLISSGSVVNGGTRIGGQVAGSSSLGYDSPANFAAPISVIVSNAYNIAGTTTAERAGLKINGQVQSPTTGGAGTTGTGNFGIYPLYLFHRYNNPPTVPSSYYFNGQFYGAIIRGAATSGNDLLSAESYMNQKSGGLY